MPISPHRRAASQLGIENSRASGRRSSPRGTATVELALCLPLLFVLLLGTIDACARVTLQQSLETSAYEGSRVAGIRTATTSDVVERCEAILAQRKIEGATITTVPAEVATASPGDIVEIEVSVICDDVGTFFGPYYRGRRATAQFACIRQSNI
jgi:Flp pilus assembly protein TadG